MNKLPLSNAGWVCFKAADWKHRLPSIAALLVVVSLPPEGIGVELCPFYWITDLPGPFCGLTRSMSALARLQFSQSLSLHPLGIYALLFLIQCAWTNDPTTKIAKISLSSNRLLEIFTFKMLACLFLIVWVVRLIFI
ncbi:MAG: DUF2752 domain-containing protein [bacterium]